MNKDVLKKANELAYQLQRLAVAEQDLATHAEAGTRTDKSGLMLRCMASLSGTLPAEIVGRWFAEAKDFVAEQADAAQKELDAL